MTSKQEIAIEHFQEEFESCKFNGSDLIIDLDDAEVINEILENVNKIESKINELEEISDNLSNASYDIDNFIDNLKEII